MLIIYYGGCDSGQFSTVTDGDFRYTAESCTGALTFTGSSVIDIKMSHTAGDSVKLEICYTGSGSGIYVSGQDN